MDETALNRILRSGLEFPAGRRGVSSFGAVDRRFCAGSCEIALGLSTASIGVSTPALGRLLLHFWTFSFLSRRGVFHQTDVLFVDFAYNLHWEVRRTQRLFIAAQRPLFFSLVRECSPHLQ